MVDFPDFRLSLQGNFPWEFSWSNNYALNHKTADGTPFMMVMSVSTVQNQILM